MLTTVIVFIAEVARITNAGGYIEYGRVNGTFCFGLDDMALCLFYATGNLALSRALGDFEFKKNYALRPEDQIITANPDITCHEISEDDEFLVLACDGAQAVFSFAMFVSLSQPIQESGTALARNKLSTLFATKFPKAKNSRR